MNNKPTQADRILQYMKDFGSITQYEAMLDLGIMRLASRIHDLRNLGVPITSKMIGVKNRYDEVVYVKSYSIATAKE